MVLELGMQSVFSVASSSGSPHPTGGIRRWIALNSSEQPQPEMAAVSDGQRPFNRFRQHDAEQRASGVRLCLAATGTEAVEVDRASLVSAAVNRLQIADLDVGRI